MATPADASLALPLPSTAGSDAPRSRQPRDPCPQPLPFTPGRRLRSPHLGEEPRQRLLLHGASVLSDAELVTILCQAQGSRGREIAARLLAPGGLGHLIGVGPNDLLHRGLSPRSAATLLAAFELARRLAREEILHQPLLNSPAEVARYLKLTYSRPDQEVLGALFLDVRHRLLASRELYRGTLTRAGVEPRAIFKQGLLLGAAGVIIFHSHPSGDPTPSNEDVLATRRFCEAGTILGIEVIDHLIFTHTGSWTSLRERIQW